MIQAARFERGAAAVSRIEIDSTVINGVGTHHRIEQCRIIIENIGDIGSAGQLFLVDR